MADISRAALFGKLDELAYRALESATVFCKMRGNPYVELSHWLHQILQQPDSDLHRIVRHYEVDAARLARDLLEALDRLPRGATAVSDLSIHVEEAVERGWLYASLKYNMPRVRVGHLTLGLTKSSSLRNALTAISREFLKLSPDDLVERLAGITAGSPEERAVGPATQADARATSEGIAPAPLGRMEALSKFSVDLTERARKREIDPIVGRDEEIRQIVHVLMRRRQNNPILTGEAGVGKTAVVEGFAQRIAAGDVPPALKDVSLRALDIGLLQAGAGVKGEFENRLRQVIEEVQSSPKPIILFIDEAHTLIGAGGAAGTGDAANLLKPALARGTLRTIAATTWAEYKKHIEKDPALTRRFQVVKVEEPTEEKATVMMRGVAGVLEQHHRVHLADAAIKAAVGLSKRYIPDRQLPDKAVSLLDTACARVAISQHAVPPPVEDARRTIEALDTELSIIDRESAIGMDVGDRRQTAERALADVKERLAGLEQRWKAEKGLVEQVLTTRDALRKARAAGGATASETDERTRRLTQLEALERELRGIQGESPLVLPGVDEQAVASVVSDWTGIPVGRMVKNEIEAVLGLADVLGKRVIGQAHALEMIAKRIQTARAGLENPNKPIGVFMLVGPSGVGKTETALALAEALYGGEQNVITINMSEFQEAHTVSTLKGAPPGYVGYGEGGVLTEAVRRRPYSVVLLDEVEKAHSDVHELFFQVFDKGWMEDGQGTRVDFKNTIILLTSNAGSDVISQLCASGRELPSEGALQAAIRPALLDVFPAALLGRMVVIPYYPLSDEMLGAIVRLQLNRIAARVSEAYDIPFTYDQAVVDLVIARCTEVESGGRMIDAVLTNSLLPQMSRELLRRNLEGSPPTKADVTASASDFAFAFE
ncbi:MAG TPA: type VI secretion system ATPase TssH [Polyangiaceae bacterium]|nr:type VI secretion system ATPase TssH [Polyangiaceae bacterium]